ncbi:MAG: glycosyltransferase [Alphaproteobacteria bacterium]
MTARSAPRLLFHVQHMLGIGHRVRAERIACACAEAGFEVTLLEGGVAGQVPDGEADRLTRIQLPPARAADAAFSGVVDADTGAPIDDAWRARRAAASLDALRAARPDILLVEGFPFARRAFRFELLPLIAEAHRGGAKAAVSIRDILVARPDRLKTAEIAEVARQNFDRILVHGDPTFAQLADSFSAAPCLADRVVYTGIVSPPPVAPGPDGHGEVIVSAGGGATGGDLIRAAVAARPMTRLKDRVWRILIGPNLPQEDRDFLETPPPGILVEPSRPDFPALLAAASLSISQAGYNTVADLAVTGCPSVLIPFAGPTGLETEQPTRARLLERAGRAISVPEAQLSPERLARAVDLAADLPRRPDAPYRTDGARRSAEALLAMTGRKGPA